MVYQDLLLRDPARGTGFFAVVLVLLGASGGRLIAFALPVVEDGLFGLPFPGISWIVLAAFIAAALLSLFVRSGWRVRRGASEVWKWRGLTFLRIETPHRIPDSRRVDIVKKIVRSRAAGESSSQRVTIYPVRIVPDSDQAPGEELPPNGVAIHSGMDYDLSRRIAEKLRKHLHCALHDASDQELRVRPWEHLDESIGQRMRRLRQEVRVGRQPAGSRVEIALKHDRTSIRIPRPGFNTAYLWFGGGFLFLISLIFVPMMFIGNQGAAPFLGLYGIAILTIAGIAGRLSLHREDIDIGPDGVSYRKGVLPLRTRRMRLEEIEEVVAPDDRTKRFDEAVRDAGLQMPAGAGPKALRGMDAMGTIRGIMLRTDRGSHELGWRLTPPEKPWFCKLLLQQIARHDRSTTQAPRVNGEVMDMRPASARDGKRWMLGVGAIALAIVALAMVLTR